MKCLFLHGALGTSQSWESFIHFLDKQIEPLFYDFPGHGENTTSLAEASYSELSKQLNDFVEANQLKDFNIVAYSMGAYVALNAIKNHSLNCNKLICIATKTNWNTEIAENECLNLYPEKLTPILDALKTKHKSNFENLLPLTRSIIQSIGNQALKPNDISQFNQNIYFLRGSKDKMVSAAENLEFVNACPNASYIELEEQGHLLERMNARQLTGIFNAILID